MQVAEAAEALRAAIIHLDGNARVVGRAVCVVVPGGRELWLEPQPIAKLSGGTIIDKPAGEGRVPVVVADVITEPSRHALGALNISWLDRRGHLRIRTDDVWIDADVPAAPRVDRPQPSRPVSGVAQVSIAAAHLLGWRPGVRELARRVGLSPTAISTARSRLTDAGLLSSAGDPAIPELFWVLADAWTPTWSDLARIPPPETGLVLAGTRAAVKLGAPIVVTADWPTELFGLDAATVSRARLRAGPAGGRVACRVALAPTPLVADPQLVTARRGRSHPRAHPLFVALDLAQDPARGAEALGSWRPAGFEPVW